jgi:thiol:disulfide interchange protein DsbD
MIVPDKTVRAGSQTEVELLATIKEGWHLYSTTQTAGGPIPTSISVVETSIFSQVDSVEASRAPLRWFDRNFGIYTEYFEKQVLFRIPVQISLKSLSETYQLSVKVRFQACSDTLCLAPQNRILTGNIRVAGLLGSQGDSAVALKRSEEIPKAQPQVEINSPVDSNVSISILAYVLGAMAMGGLALLTPCVFPMIPITVSYFTRRDTDGKKAVKEAAFYAIGIILTFTVIGFTMTFMFGAGGINRLAASPIVNILIAMIFIVFALSLFGITQIRLPSNWINAVDRYSSSSGGILGILLMAVTFSLTSFTCTVPFVGTVMVAALHGDLLWALLGVASFATVFAAPFFFLALFPSCLQALPKSGNWMNSMKITMGFLELAAALKFISNVDLIYQWEILTRPVFIAVWLSIGLIATLYLLGKFQFPNDPPVDSVGAVRVLSAIFFFAVTIYLMRGFFGFPLGELDAFLPPRNYGESSSFTSVFGKVPEKQEKWLTNYQEALEQAEEQNRPVFIDFTGYTCTNCRWMESNIFTLDEVQSLFGQFVLVQLYTDGIKQEHEENLRFEQERFGTIALPLYAVMSSQDQIISTFPGLTRNSEEFISFLKDGLVQSKGETDQF